MDAIRTATSVGGILPLSSQRTLPGRPFTPGPEAELAAHIHDLAVRLPGVRKSGVLLIREMPGPFGVVDFSAVLPNPEILLARLAAGYPPILSEVDATVVSVMSGTRHWSIRTIASRLDWSAHIVEGRLHGLRRAGIVARNSAGSWIRHGTAVPVGRLHIFEMKVRDWRKAINQACTYAAWADSASVVVNQLSRTARLFEDSPEWLGFALNEAWLRKPKILQHSKARRLWASEHVVAALIGYQPSPAA